MRAACLVDVTRCVGCRSCQVACKQSNDLADDATRFFAGKGGYENPGKFTPRTFTYISYHEFEDANGLPVWTFVKRQCLHCEQLYCSFVCPPQLFRKTETGVVTCDPDACIGCAACIDACPFQVPTIDYWNVATPRLRKCEFCLHRQESDDDRPTLDGTPLAGKARERHLHALHTPACAGACPTGAIEFGDRTALLAEGHRRIADAPDRYLDHIYGEKEAGGTGWLYLSAVPFARLGFPAELPGHESLDAIGGSSGGVRGKVATLLAGVCWFFRRREEVRGRKDS